MPLGWVGRHRRLVATVGVLLAVYAGSYLYLSRRAAPWCEAHGSFLLYVLPPDTRHWWTLHKVAYFVYLPANWVDRQLGTRYDPVTSMMFVDPNGGGLWRCEGVGEF